MEYGRTTLQWRFDRVALGLQDFHSWSYLCWITPVFPCVG